MTSFRPFWPVPLMLLGLAWRPVAPSAASFDKPDQSEQSYRGAIGLIQQEERRGSRLVETVGYLTDIYGPRLTGSPHLKAASEYIIQQLNTWRVSGAKYERWGPFGPGWSNDRTLALALSPQAYPLVAYPKAWTPGTSGDVVAEALWAPIAKESDFERYRGKLAGKFVLTEPLPAPTANVGAPVHRYTSDELADLATAPPPPTAGQSSADLTFARKRMAFFVDEKVAALIEPGRDSRGAVFVGDGKLSDDATFSGPGFYPWPETVALQVVIPNDQYSRIVRTLEKRIPVTLEMDVVNAYHPAEPDSFNIIAELPGTDLASEVVMIGAHFDSWHGGTGATDNAAGCAVVLEAMRLLRASGLETRRTIRMALWTGSEQGLQGSRAYITHHFADPATMKPKPEHAGLSAYFNVDGGTGLIRGVFTTGNTAAAPILDSWMAPFKGAGMTTTSPRAGDVSDHLSFDAVGLPAFHFIQDPLELGRTRHSSIDVYERLNMSDLLQNAVIVASLAYQAANQPGPMPRKALPAPDPRWAFPILPR